MITTKKSSSSFPTKNKSEVKKHMQGIATTSNQDTHLSTNNTANKTTQVKPIKLIRTTPINLNTNKLSQTIIVPTHIRFTHEKEIPKPCKSRPNNNHVACTTRTAKKPITKLIYRSSERLPSTLATIIIQR